MNTPILLIAVLLSPAAWFPHVPFDVTLPWCAAPLERSLFEALLTPGLFASGSLSGFLATIRPAAVATRSPDWITVILNANMIISFVAGFAALLHDCAIVPDTALLLVLSVMIPLIIVTTIHRARRSAADPSVPPRSEHHR